MTKVTEFDPGIPEAGKALIPFVRKASGSNPAKNLSVDPDDLPLTKAMVNALALKTNATQVQQIVSDLLVEWGYEPGEGGGGTVPLPTMDASAVSRTISQDELAPGTVLATYTLSGPLPTGVSPKVVPYDGRVALSPVGTNNTFTLKVGASVISAGDIQFTVSLTGPGTSGAPVKTFDLEVQPAEVIPTNGYSAVLTNKSGATWTFNTDGKSSTARGIAQRITTTIPKSFLGVASTRVVIDVYSRGWADFALRNDGAMILDGGAAEISMKLYKDGVLKVDKAMDKIWQYTGRLYPIGTPVYPTMPTTQQLEDSAAIHRYIEGPVLEATIAGYDAVVKSADWNALGSTRGIAQYMPGTGGRDDIGQLPNAQAAYLCSRDDRLLKYVIGQAEAALHIPWMFWDAANNDWLNTNNYPRIWIDGRGGTGTPGDRNSGGLTQQVPSTEQTGWTPEIAHQPELSFLAYLLTKREAFRDNVIAQAHWSIISIWMDMRGWDETGVQGKRVVQGNQVRGSAWCLRQLENAKYVADPGSPEKTYFTAACNHNWKWWRDQTPTWTLTQKATSGYIPVFNDEDNGLIREWQQDYTIGVAAIATRRGGGYAGAMLQWMANHAKGRSKYLGNDASTYLTKVADANKVALGTWALIKQGTIDTDQSNGDGWAHSDGDYSQLYIGSLRMIWQALGDTEARDLADAYLLRNPPHTSAASYLEIPMNRFENSGSYSVVIPENPNDGPGGGTTPDPEPEPEPSASLVFATTATTFFPPYALNRAVVVGYAGPLMDLRRTSDGGVITISVGDDYVTKFNTFAQGGEVTCTKLYAQDTNGVHATNPTPGNRPLVVVRNGMLALDPGQEGGRWLEAQLTVDSFDFGVAAMVEQRGFAFSADIVSFTANGDTGNTDSQKSFAMMHEPSNNEGTKVGVRMKEPYDHEEIRVPGTGIAEGSRGFIALAYRTGAAGVAQINNKQVIGQAVWSENKVGPIGTLRIGSTGTGEHNHFNGYIYEVVPHLETIPADMNIVRLNMADKYGTTKAALA